ncbi:MAG TPA: MFS transporter [Burkholderiaceae bacterium]|jgi:MFS family permease|nr:MFS transporter [Burkholderiaceae bacterium]
MPPSRSHALLLNLAHLLDHFFLLIFPTAVLAISQEWGRSFGELLPLSLPMIAIFGLGALPSGWLADRWSRRGMMGAFFFGIGSASVLAGLAQGPTQLMLALAAIGVFAAIYHPVGIAMLTIGTPRLGWTLGVNGVWGNIGLGVAALVTGVIVQFHGWRAAFILPGLLTIAIGFIYLYSSRGATNAASGRKPASVTVPRELMMRVVIVFLVAVVCNGVLFHATTISMPKLFDERLAGLMIGQAGLGAIGAVIAVIYLIAAMAQLAVGALIDRTPLRRTLIGVIALQPVLLAAAAWSSGWTLVAVALGVMFFVFGQIPINDAMVARYTSDRYRSRAYGLRYVASFMGSASAVTIVSVLHTAGGFSSVFVALSIVAAIALVAAVMLPRLGEGEAAAPVAAAQNRA